jgi:aromatase
MAGHIDIGDVVQAPLELTWQVTNDVRTMNTAGGRTTVVRVDERLRSVVLAIAVSTPDGKPVTQYYVERVLDPGRHLVYARRWGHPDLVYSHALWLYRAISADRTEIRSVQDFEIAPTAAVSEKCMVQQMHRATETALGHARREAELRYAEAVSRGPGLA